MTVQERIRKLMEVKGWSEYRLAKEAHLPQSTISHMFKRNNAPTIPTTEAICHVFGLTLSQFFAEEQKEWMLLWGSLSEEQRSIIKATMKNFSEE
mgnify:CR=1 FL=1